MSTDFSFKIKNYKCFGDQPQGFDTTKPINVIIGKNNSGKSSLLDVIPYLIAPADSKLAWNSNTQVIITQHITEALIRSNFSESTSGGNIPGQSHFEYAKRYIDTDVSYSINNNKKTILGSEIPIKIPEVARIFESLVSRIKTPYDGKTFFYVTAERNINPEAENTNLNINANGDGITGLLSAIINNVKHDSRIVQKRLFNNLTKIVQPDIELVNITAKKHENNHWEIFFESENEILIALSKMGSGIKTILHVLTNLIVLPEIKGKKLEDCIFAFEELENNLHPAMQRRLFAYLKDFIISNNTTVFITTHSNIVIDIFGNVPEAQIIHVKKEGKETFVRSTASFPTNKNILDDIGVKASDILQSNGIVWVEGPSDRTYINKWISLLRPDLQEGMHYSILHYGGKLLSNFCFDYEGLEKELIPLLKINTNAFVVLDKDGKTVSTPLNTTKTRIQAEIGNTNCWITKGREIENYLTKNTLENWLFNTHNIKADIIISNFEKIETFLLNAKVKLKPPYNALKNLYASEIIDFITKDDLDILDLKHNLNALIATISEWNK